MVRLRRIASDLLAGGVQKAVEVSGRGPRLAFTYHGVGLMPGAVPAPIFEAQLSQARRAGFQFVSLARMAAWSRGEAELPGLALALTFDDGLADTARVAGPILKRLGIVATVFPVLEFLGGPRRYVSARCRAILLEDDGDAETMGWDYMTWEELDGWVEAGGEVGGHTLTHPHLSDLHESDGLQEVSGCLAQLESRYGCPPQVFCYPYGDHSDASASWVRRAGFQAAVTTAEGVMHRGSNPFLLPRLPAPAEAGRVFSDLLYGTFRWRHLIRRAWGGGKG